MVSLARAVLVICGVVVDLLPAAGAGDGEQRPYRGFAPTVDVCAIARRVLVLVDRVTRQNGRCQQADQERSGKSSPVSSVVRAHWPRLGYEPHSPIGCRKASLSLGARLLGKPSRGVTPRRVP
jgi:hypothetical protein